MQMCPLRLDLDAHRVGVDQLVNPAGAGEGVEPASALGDEAGDLSEHTGVNFAGCLIEGSVSKTVIGRGSSTS